MAFMDDFADLLTETVQLSTRQATGRYGTFTWGTPTTVTARIVDVVQELRSDRGVMGVVTSEIWVASTKQWDSETRIVLPDGSTKPVLAVEVFRDENGITHSKFRLGDRLGEQRAFGGERL